MFPFPEPEPLLEPTLLIISPCDCCSMKSFLTRLVCCFDVIFELPKV